MEFKFTTDSWFVFSTFFISLLALCVFLYTTISYVSRNKNLKRRRLRLKRRVDNYNKLEKRLSERKISNLEEDNTKLQINLLKDLKQMLGSDKPDLTLFFSNFEKIYPEYAQSLQKIIPDITANELKLCAFLRLNLSSKEISSLFNISPDSVNKARYRLRKKIELDSNDDLFIFLSSI